MTTNHSNVTLLLVDDEAMNRDALSRRLVRKGYTVLTAESGPRALEIASEHRVDAVLLDVMMPGMSGIETLKRLRESRSAAELPVIMVTALDRSEDVVEALELGANDYVTKPVDFPIALARIRTQVSARRADPLTGLPNRVLFMDRLSRLVERNRKLPDVNFAVFFLDVDRFKTVNDSLGHLIGDELLLGVAHRLEQSLRATDTVSRFSGEHTLARLGGDEFTIILDEVASADDARRVAERLCAEVAAPFNLQGREIFVSISVGIVMSDPRYEDAGAMVRDADTAMYQAKARGKARAALFDASMLAAAEQRLRLETDLRHVLDRNELRVFYQPIVILSANKLCGFEALLRWEHPEFGLVSPSDFIPAAEDTGLIVPIGLWVMREACRQLRRWDAMFPACDDLTVNVNVSPRQCVRRELVQEVADVLAETGLSPGRLKLEVTETVVTRELRRGDRNAQRHSCARRAARPRRLRHGLLGARLLETLPVSDREDRPLLRGRHARVRQHRDHPGHRLARRRVVDERHGRGRRNGRTGRRPQGPLVRPRPGLLLRQAALERRLGEAPGRPEVAARRPRASSRNGLWESPRAMTEAQTRDYFVASAADDVAVVDGPANQRPSASADDRAERLRSPWSDDVAEHTTTDAADDQAGRAVVAPAVIAAVGAPVDAIASAQPSRTIATIVVSVVTDRIPVAVARVVAVFTTVPSILPTIQPIFPPILSVLATIPPVLVTITALLVLLPGLRRRRHADE